LHLYQRRGAHVNSIEGEVYNASFILDFDRPLHEFGFGLGFAVLVDALVIRSLLMPAIMHLIGPANWAMPSWLGRVLPNLSVEVDEDAIPLPPSEEPVARQVS
jgi:hypothetical protein